MQELYSSLMVVAVGVLGYALHALRRRDTSPSVIWPRDMTVHLHVAAPENGGLPVAVSLPTDAEESSRAEEPPQSLEIEEPPSSPRFLIDSLTLLICYRYLFGNRSTRRVAGPGWGFRESFHYLTGLRVDRDTFVLSHLLPVQFAEQHSGGVVVSQPSNIDMFTALDALQLPLLGHCHSHPGTAGALSTRPSEIDHRFQARLEQGRCQAIGLIFARCSEEGVAYVRFFGGKHSDFQVEVQGAHVEQVEDHVFKLSLDNNQLPIATVIAR